MNRSHFFTFSQTITNLVSRDRYSRVEYFYQRIFENHQNRKEIKEKENVQLFYFYIYMKVKSIPLESPILADFKYIICFSSTSLVFKKINCFWTQLTEFVFFAYIKIMKIYGGMTKKLKIVLFNPSILTIPQRS